MPRLPPRRRLRTIYHMEHRRDPDEVTATLALAATYYNRSLLQGAGYAWIGEECAELTYHQLTDHATGPAGMRATQAAIELLAAREDPYSQTAAQLAAVFGDPDELREAVTAVIDGNKSGETQASGSPESSTERAARRLNR